ncbi:hypothetical protein CC2G_005924 [Coprinopsis cinerea AmutBmut pab1-1]|nr:hypothetical protein CC2G_005924 [Coprinopsis cinerea AmutBmut pab1-1]
MTGSSTTTSGTATLSSVCFNPVSTGRTLLSSAYPVSVAEDLRAANKGVIATLCTKSNAHKLHEAHPPSTPLSQEQEESNVITSPETPHKAYQSAPTSPSGRIGNLVRCTDANDDDNDQVEEEEEVAQALNPQPTPQTFQALHTALSTIPTDTYAQHLKGYPTPVPASAYTTHPIHPPLHTTRESEGTTSDLQRAEQTPPKSQPNSFIPPHPNTTSILNLMMNNETLIQLLQEQQRTTQRIQEALDKLLNKTASTCSPVKEPEPFKGHPSDTHHFLQYFHLSHPVRARATAGSRYVQLHPSYTLNTI